MRSENLRCGAREEREVRRLQAGNSGISVLVGMGSESLRCGAREEREVRRPGNSGISVLVGMGSESLRCGAIPAHLSEAASAS